MCSYLSPTLGSVLLLPVAHAEFLFLGVDSKHESWCLDLHVVGVFPAEAAAGVNNFRLRGTIEGHLNTGHGDSSLPAGPGFDRGRFYTSLAAAGPWRRHFEGFPRVCR